MLDAVEELVEGLVSLAALKRRGMCWWCLKMLSAPPKCRGEPRVEPTSSQRSAGRLHFPSSFLRHLSILIYFYFLFLLLLLFFLQIVILREAWSAAKAFFNFQSL